MFSLPQAETTITQRTPANNYLVLDSADRFQTASVMFDSFGAAVTKWNDFVLQRPQSLIQAYAQRIQVSEVRFPWFIPNITEYNNTIYASYNGVNKAFILPVGFYSPPDLVTALGAAFNAPTPQGFGAGAVVVSYANFRYTLEAPTGLLVISAGAVDNLTDSKYDATPSLMKTLGFTSIQQGQPITSPATMTGQITLSSYTDYVDIVSERLNYYTDVKDGSSSNDRAKDALVCRLYATDEASLPLNAGVPQTCAPFVIYRQFKNPKNIQYDPKSVVDYLDIKIFDMYGNLVPLPTYKIKDTESAIPSAYPDFQITLLASES